MMKFLRLIFLSLSLVTTFSCDTGAQLVDGSGNVVLKSKFDYYTQDYYVVVAIGDSNADGAATGIPTVGANTLIKWNNTTGALDEINTQSVANDSPTKGSIWQSFATAYKAANGKPVLLINAAKGGSTFFSSTYSWYTSGTLYTDMLSQVSNALAATGETVDLFVINLGLNDVRASFTLGNITLGVSSLISRLETHFPGTPKVFIPVGRTETDINSLALFDVREMMVDQVQANTNFYMCGSPQALSFLNGYETDGYHYNTFACATLGQNLVNWIGNSSYSKWGRAVISTLFDSPSSARKTLIDDAVSTEVTNGNYFKMDGWHVFITTTENNIYIDWTMIGYAALRTATFTANDAISFNGSTYADLAYVSNFQTRRSTQNDIIASAYVKTRSNTTSSYIFGGFNGTHGTGVLQQASPSPIRCLANNGTFLNGTDVLFAAGNYYGVGRNGTTQEVYKNASTQATAVQASSGTHNFPWSLGAINSSGTRALFTTGSIDCVVIGLRTGFDLSAWQTTMNTLRSGW